MQLDLFLDGREAILIKELVAELLEGRAASARKGLDRLRDENQRRASGPSSDVQCRRHR
jgi:hypothetical protein